MDNNQLQNPDAEQQNNYNMDQQSQQGYPYMGQQSMVQPSMDPQFQQGYTYMDQQTMGAQSQQGYPYMGQQPMEQQPIQQDPNAGQYTYTIPWMNGTGTANNTTAYTPVPQPSQNNFGQPYIPSQPYPPMARQQQQSGGMGLAIAGMVFGILSILLCICNILDLVLVLPGIILSGVALAGHHEGKGMAIAGLVCSIIGFLLSGLTFFMAFIV
ncbi:MAG: hypothetical protein J1E65_00595 [Lachnospiraceae bacterium]|nr:hypothetical protein [Lachnospiraceae bacterium]